jgi:hypothetical protein
MKARHIGPYVLSLPERVVRSVAALAGGVVHGIGHVTLPAALRRTKFYRSVVGVTLRFVVERVGQVQGTFPPEGALARDFLSRRTAGNGIELMGILAFRASPVWVMAALADLSGTGRHLIQDIAASLREEGLLDPDTPFSNLSSMDQLLDGLEKSASRVADAFATPPLDIAGLRREWAALRKEVASMRGPSRADLPSGTSLRRRWIEMKREAARQELSVFALSSLMAMSAVRRLPEGLVKVSKGVGIAGKRTGALLLGPLFDHYAQTLHEIHQAGYVEYWRREFSPYLRAAAAQFSPAHRSLTQRLLRGKGIKPQRH